MFHSWINKDLIPPLPCSNILSAFPVEVQTSVVSSITRHLANENNQQQFTSIAHIWWTMETIGQAFQLPELDVASDAVAIYSRWLLEKTRRPEPVRTSTQEIASSSSNPNFQKFLQTIILQYSLLFEQHQAPPGSDEKMWMKEYAELCRKVLKILTMLARVLPHELDLQTWQVLLTMICSVTDFSLHAGSQQDVYAILCEDLLRALTELWIRSNTRDPRLWELLGRCFPLWTSHEYALQQWAGASLALTRRVIRILYGKSEGSGSVDISINGFSIKLDPPEAFVVFAWQRMLYIVGDITSVPAKNFALVIMGIGKMVESFQAVGFQKDTQKLPPDGNTILDLYGRWLFDTCVMDGAEFSEGRAEAFGILCRIFSQQQKRQPFNRIYLERFYALLIKGLRDFTVLPVILMNSTDLFTTNLESVRLLVPDFLVGVRAILPKFASKLKSKITVPRLRLAAIQIVATIFCLPEYDRELTAQSLPDIECDDDQELLVMGMIQALMIEQNIDSSSFAAKFRILEILLMSITTELSSYNMRYLLHLIDVYVAENVSYCPGLVRVVAKTIQEKILTFELGEDVTVGALNLMIHFVEYYYCIAYSITAQESKVLLSIFDDRIAHVS